MSPPRAKWFENTRPIDINVYSYRKPFRQFTRQILNEVEDSRSNRRQLLHLDNSELERHLRWVLVDLFDLWVTHGNRKHGLGVDRNRNKWVMAKRYNALGLRYQPALRVLDALEESRLIEVKKGFKDPRSGFGANTKIRSSLRLVRRFREANLNRDELDPPTNYETIWLAKTEKVVDPGAFWTNPRRIRTWVDYEETEQTAKMRQQLANYLHELTRHTIVLSESGTLSRKDLLKARRIFGYQVAHDFKRGGRLYWHASWQSLSKRDRSKVLIDNQEVVEADYRSFQPNIAYALAGIQPSDPYEPISLYPQEFPGSTGIGPHWQIGRKFIKRVLNGLFYVRNQRAAIAYITSLYSHPDLDEEHRQFSELWPTLNTTPTALIKRIIGWREHLLPYLMSDKGMYLQWIDSEICMSVLEILTNQHIPVLPIHDSFLVKRRDRNHLVSSMFEAFTLHTKIKISSPSYLINVDSLD